MNKSEKSKHLFSSDRAINSANEDRLNRAKFSKELATTISNWTEKDSLVVAIYGNWGDGKTSVKNMVKEEFDRRGAPKFIEFNPWQWGYEELLMEAFFKELATKIGESNDRTQKEIAKKLLDYVEYLEVGNELAEKAKAGAEKILLMSFGASSIFAAFVPASLKPWLVALAVFFLLLTVLLKELIWCFKWIARFLNLDAKKSENLEEKKNELRKCLSEMKSTIVVFIDDIDRLSKNEVRNLFRIIKANADFPNIVYLTLFQRDIVEKSLGDGEIFSGSEYLKKIVQVGFSLPKVPLSDIHQILFKELDRLLVESGLNQKFESGRWNELFIEGISGYFKNLRDVNRFISVFSFHLGILKNDSTHEVNFIDLIGLEVLRQFEPRVYEAIFLAKKLMTKSSGYGSSYAQNEEKKEMEGILAGSSEGKTDSVKNIIKVLFPNSQWAWGANIHSNVGDSEFIDLRVNHDEIFDRYFSLFIASDDFSKAEFENIMSVSNDENKLMAAFMKYYEQGRLPSFIQKFEAYKQAVSTTNAIPFITVIMNLGDLLSDEHSGFMISPLTHAKRIIHWFFQKPEFKDQVERANVYFECLRRSSGIVLPSIILFDELEKRNIDRYPDHYILMSRDRKELSDLLISKYEANQGREEFRKNIHLPRIMYIWLQVDRPKAKIWLSDYLKDDNNLVSFLIRLENKGTSSTGYETTVNYYIQLAWLKEFFEDLEGLFSRIKALSVTYPKNVDRVARVFENIERAEDQHKHPDKYPDILKGR